jgi:hypothetical protein
MPAREVRTWGPVLMDSHQSRDQHMEVLKTVIRGQPGIDHTYIHIYILPVVLRKAVVEVSKIGRYRGGELL